jgi:hypothetical protein
MGYSIYLLFYFLRKRSDLVCVVVHFFVVVTYICFFIVFILSNFFVIFLA